MTTAVPVASPARPGRPCLLALVAALAEVRKDDPLAPAVVIVPGPLAGLHVRRALGRLGGTAAIDFVTSAQLAERLAAPIRAGAGARPLPPSGWEEAVRVALAADPGPFRAVAHHPAAVTRVAAALRRLRSATPAERAALAATSGAGRRAAHMVRLLEAVEGSTAGHHDRGTAGPVACAAVAGGVDPGPVVAFCPRGTDPDEVDLLAALATRGRLRVVAAVTGEAAADAPVSALVERLDGPGSWRSPTEGPPVPDHLVLAPDAEAEGRLVVQQVVASIEAGMAGHDICVLAFGGAAGLGRVADLLDAAGVPWSGPAGASLATTPTGRALLALLGLEAEGWSHAGVLAALSSAPVRRGPDRPGPLPLGRWAALARRANVVGGRGQWEERPAALAARLRRSGDEATAAALDDLAAFARELAAALSPPEARSWPSLARWALAVLDQHLGPSGPSEREELGPSGPSDRGAPGPDGWPDAAVAAHGAVRAVVAAVADLDQLAGDPSEGPGPGDLLATLEAALMARPAPRRGRVGRGVLVATDPADLLGATPELLLLTGVVEGAVPARGADDPLVPDIELQLVNRAPSRAAGRAAERAAVLAAVAAAGRTVASCHRADAQASRRPSRWFLRWAGMLAGAQSPLGADDIEGAAGPWITVVPSFTAAACGPLAGSVQERRLSALALVPGGVDGAGLAASPLVAEHPALSRAVAASQARRSARFTAWDGLLGRRLALDVEVSASALEEWATCPQRYLLHHVLGVAATEAPGDALDIDGGDRGTLAHQVLAAVVGRGLGRPPSEPWADADRAFLVAELRRRADELRRHGRMGTGVLADLRLDELQASLLAVLDQDDAVRADEGWVPTAVEEGFGERAAQPVEVTLPSGRSVRFKGRIDRVDTDAAGQLRVVDYKTGRGRRYLDAAAGATAPARLLQLAVYEAAARSAHPGAAVSSGWWLVDAEGKDGRPVPIVPNHLAPAQLHAALEAITDGIEAGVFPVDPGEDGYRGPENCRFCPYDRICPTDRVRALQRVAGDPALAPWRALQAVGEVPDGR